MKHESNDKSQPCLEWTSGTTGWLQLHRPPPPPLPPLLPPPLLSCSPSLMPVKGLSCRAWIHLCGTTTEKPPKALNSSSSPLPPSLHLFCYHHQLLSPSPLHSTLSFPAAPASCSVWTAASWKPATPARLLLLSASRALHSQRAALRAVDLHVVTCQHRKNRYRGWGTSIWHRGGLVETRQTDRYCIKGIRKTTVNWFCTAENSLLGEDKLKSLENVWRKRHFHNEQVCSVLRCHDLIVTYKRKV